MCVRACVLSRVWLFATTQTLARYNCCFLTKLCPTLRYHGLQHARLPCPSLSLGVCSNAWHIPKRDSKLIGLICKEKLGRFSENPDKFRDEFVRLQLAVSFMWQDIMVILAHLGWKGAYTEKGWGTCRWPAGHQSTLNLSGGWGFNPRTWPTQGLWRSCWPG